MKKPKSQKPGDGKIGVLLFVLNFPKEYLHVQKTSDE
jgi:hypothetical protein